MTLAYLKITNFQSRLPQLWSSRTSVQHLLVSASTHLSKRNQVTTRTLQNLTTCWGGNLIQVWKQTHLKCAVQQDSRARIEEACSKGYLKQKLYFI